ncbi:type II toxin-antitoxin system HicB family antitoxin [Candidatus Peregrinibacteria bacterium]|nr:type II toxin-antitoxin system HicB family antitoxin [Candidatus Peregrinibacteria bacterium]MBI3816098.1 type II toxin-antitoxin system HicB family antitoxin [Candidatus Peregrinibacteria bacterium]
MVFTAVIYREGSLFVAACPEIGSVSQGENMEEALQNLQEATELYLEEFPHTAAADRSFITTFQTARA